MSFFFYGGIFYRLRAMVPGLGCNGDGIDIGIQLQEK